MSPTTNSSNASVARGEKIKNTHTKSSPGKDNTLSGYLIEKLAPYGSSCAKKPERTEKPIGTWDTEDKGGKEIGHTQEAK